MKRHKDGYREPLTAEQIENMINETVQGLVKVCGPADALLVALGVTKTIMEMVRMNCETDSQADQLLNDALELAGAVHVAQRQKLADENEDDDDPFRITN